MCRARASRLATWSPPRSSRPTATTWSPAPAPSDALDGYLARKLGQETPVGRQLDPLVDKLIVGAALVHLLPLKGSGLMPWMVTTIVVRELIVQALRSLIEGRGEPFGARM